MIDEWKNTLTKRRESAGPEEPRHSDLKRKAHTSRIWRLKGWQGMADSSTSPIMTCAGSLHHGGSYAQAHRTPDTRSSVPLRHRLLPAAAGLPTRRQGHCRGALDRPLRRRGAPPPSPRPAADSGTPPARRPTPTPCTPTCSTSRGSSARSTPPSPTTCPGRCVARASDRFASAST